MYTTRLQLWHVSAILFVLTSLTGSDSDDNDVNPLKHLPDVQRLDEPPFWNNNQGVGDKQPPIGVQEFPRQDDAEMERRKRDTVERKELKQPLDRVYYDTQWLLESFPLLKTPVTRSPFPTFGMVWPLPRFWMATQRFYPVLADKLKFKLTLTNNYILSAAIQRYHQLIKSRAGISTYSNLWNHQEADLEKSRKMAFREKNSLEFGTAGTDPLSATSPSTFWNQVRVNQFHQKLGIPYVDASYGITVIHIHVNSHGLPWPHQNMDESYILSATERGIHLYANETWGGLRGLESLSQMIWCTGDRKRMYINQTFINDYPRFRHRGLMIDTSRHYISRNIIFLNLEAMSYNKMNVLHWHMIDDQSFPYQSEEFPELSEKGAYGPHAVYTVSDIKQIIEFARLRGIRVIPEFDVPGHTRSMSLSKPDIMAKCTTQGQDRVYFGTLNPLSEETFQFLHKLYEEIMKLFQDHFIHVGGDEVETDCWYSDDNLQRLRIKLGLDSSKMMLEYFWRNMQNVITIIGQKNANLRRTMIMWEDVLEQTVEVKPDSLIHVWKSKPEPFLQNRENIIFSTCWYLDHIEKATDWTTFYLCDPTTGEASVVDHTYEGQIVGGEACMWAEFQTDDTILQKIWPVTATVAERLWSSATVNSMSTVGPRLEEQSCRMSSRGIPVQTLMGPGHCGTSQRSANPVQPSRSPMDDTACRLPEPVNYELPVYYTFGVATGILFTYLLIWLFSQNGQVGTQNLSLCFNRRYFFLRFITVAVIVLILYHILVKIIVQ